MGELSRETFEEIAKGDVRREIPVIPVCYDSGNLNIYTFVLGLMHLVIIPGVYRLVLLQPYNDVISYCMTKVSKTNNTISIK